MPFPRRRRARRHLDAGTMRLFIDWTANRALRQLCPPPPIARRRGWKLETAEPAPSGV